MANRSKSTSTYVLWVLFGINMMNFFDRQILAAVTEPIRKEWGLNDSALGWLNTAFVLLYAAVGVPLGRLSDRWLRTRILAIGVSIWSLFTAASGLAWNYWSLFAVRLGVGVGEASCAPAANSLIGISFRRRGEPARFQFSCLDCPSVSSPAICRAGSSRSSTAGALPFSLSASPVDRKSVV